MVQGPLTLGIHTRDWILILAARGGGLWIGLNLWPHERTLGDYEAGKRQHSECSVEEMQDMNRDQIHRVELVKIAKGQVHSQLGLSGVKLMNCKFYLF